MKTQIKRNQTKRLGTLRANLLAAVSELDLKGTNPTITQAMCIIEEAFNLAARDKFPDAKKIFLLGNAKAKFVG
jgi:hypothetical protein